VYSFPCVTGLCPVPPCSSLSRLPLCAFGLLFLVVRHRFFLDDGSSMFFPGFSTWLKSPRSSYVFLLSLILSFGSYFLIHLSSPSQSILGGRLSRCFSQSSGAVGTLCPPPLHCMLRAAGDNVSVAHGTCTPQQYRRCGPTCVFCHLF